MSESIYNLLQTLNKTEKSRFSEGLRQTKRLGYYKKLLTVYGNAKAYNSELDIRVFKKAERKLINECKSHFKDALHNFLISSKKNSSKQESIRKNFETACMLMSRLQYVDALKLLKRTYKLAQENSEILYTLLIGERIMYLEKHKDITLHRVNLDNMKKWHTRHIQEIEKYKEYRLAFHELWINLGLFYKAQGFKEYNQSTIDEYVNNNFKLNYVSAEKEYYKSLLSNDFKTQHKHLSNLLNTLYDNKEHLDNPSSKKDYLYYLSAFIGLCISVRKFDKVNFALKEFDSYALESKRLYNNSVKYKLIAYCKYVVFIGEPALVKDLEIEFLTKRIYKKDFLATACYAELLIVNCVLGNWDRCSEYISKLEKIKTTAYYVMMKDLIKIMVAINKKDYVYAQSLISTFNYKTVDKSSLKFIKKYVQILKHKVKSNSETPIVLIDELLQSTKVFPDNFVFFIRYLEANTSIHQSDVYAKFLKKNKIKRYKP